jgi:hypothetical protein
MPTYWKYETVPGLRPEVSGHWIEIDSRHYGISWSAQTGGESDRHGKITLGGIVPWKIAPFSLANLAIINSPWPLQAWADDGLLGTVRLANGEICYWPTRGYGSFGPKIAPPSQVAPQRPQAAPVPHWLKNFLLWLRPRMSGTGTVHIGGFEFDEKELSLLAGVPVRKPHYRQ